MNIWGHNKIHHYLHNFIYTQNFCRLARVNVYESHLHCLCVGVNGMTYIRGKCKFNEYGRVSAIDLHLHDGT